MSAEKGGVLYFLGVCRLIGFDNYFAVWDKDEDLENTGLLDEANIQKGKRSFEWFKNSRRR